MSTYITTEQDKRLSDESAPKKIKLCLLVLGSREPDKKEKEECIKVIISILTGLYLEHTSNTVWSLQYTFDRTKQSLESDNEPWSLYIFEPDFHDDFFDPGFSADIIRLQKKVGDKCIGIIDDALMSVRAELSKSYNEDFTKEQWWTRKKS